MALTYLEIVNAVLRDTNEVPLSAQQFTQARGFHSFIKEAVNRALMDIVNESEEWPWLAAAPLEGELSAYTHEMDTDRKVAIYQFPEGVMSVDWDTFMLVDPWETEASKLVPISYEQWYAMNGADVLSKREASQLARPAAVYRLKDNSGFGLTPVPDKDYKVSFVSWQTPSMLISPTDPIPFPDRFYTVLVNRARYYAWMFRENPQQAQQAFRDYDSGLRKMKEALIKPVFNVMRTR